VERFGDKLEAHDWSALGSLLGKAEFIVNTTSLGMEGQPPLKIDLQGARSDAMATDIVYVPLDTPFLKLAAVAGLKTCDGLGMLLHQAAPGFEHWFGRRPTVNEELRALIVSDLGEKAGT
jgi:shikimate dehydrogenase